MPMMRRSSFEKMSGEPSSLPDETIAVDVSTTETPGVVITATTERGGTGAVTTAMTSEASDLATTTMK